MKRFLLLLLLSPAAHARCAAYLTQAELLKVDSPVTRELRRFARGDLYVRMSWSDSREIHFPPEIGKLIDERGQTRPTHPAIPLIPPPERGYAVLLRVMVRTPERLLPAIVNARLANAGGVYQLRIEVDPAQPEVVLPRTEETVAIYTMLNAAPYVSEVTFAMDLAEADHAELVKSLHTDLIENVSIENSAGAFMGSAYDFFNAHPKFVREARCVLWGYRKGREVELDLAHDFHAEFRFTLDDGAVERLTSAGRTLQ